MGRTEVVLGTLFQSSPFVRWTLTPLLIIFPVTMVYLISSGTAKPGSEWIMAGLVAMPVATLVGLWTQRRVRSIAWRVVTGVAFAFVAWYVVQEWIVSNKPILGSGSPGSATPLHALAALAVIGLPCLWYTIFGRFRLNP